MLQYLGMMAPLLSRLAPTAFRTLSGLLGGTGFGSTLARGAVAGVGAYGAQQMISHFMGGRESFGTGGPLEGQVAYSWNTGTAEFYRLTDGRIAVQRKDGTWKVWRPRFHNPAAPPKKLTKARRRFQSAARQWRKVDTVIKQSRKVKQRRRRT